MAAWIAVPRELTKAWNRPSSICTHALLRSACKAFLTLAEIRAEDGEPARCGSSSPPQGDAGNAAAGWLRPLPSTSEIKLEISSPKRPMATKSTSFVEKVQARLEFPGHHVPSADIKIDRKGIDLAAPWCSGGRKDVYSRLVFGACPDYKEPF
jgi:hypothetical protein